MSFKQVMKTLFKDSYFSWLFPGNLNTEIHFQEKKKKKDKGSALF